MSEGAAGHMRATGSRRRAKTKTPGWAALDLQRRLEQGKVDGAEVDLFPPLIPNSSSSNSNDRGLGLSWVGCIRNGQKNLDMTTGYSTDINFKSVKTLVSGKSSAESDNDVESYYPSASLDVENRLVTDQVSQNQLAVEKLKVLYPWADESLIDDVLMAVGYDHEQASASLESMLATDSSDLTGICEGFAKATAKECFCVNCDATSKYLGPEDEDPGDPDRKSPVGFMLIAPLEPEWEGDDDVYWKNRKDGLRMSRVAGRHSKNAQNAYLRGDYHTTSIMSKKSQQEYLAAEKLNTKAANEILQIRNEKHNVWKLDLHGLHALEAVDALASRLEMIEYTVSKNISASSGQNSSFHTDEQSLQVLSACMSRPSELEVITGLGIHSHGGAALPMAIKNFLVDK
ncbi:hypothetical protein KI387_035249, partial [Taxus chinensis]